jgi:hypothetical protein
LGDKLVTGANEMRKYIVKLTQEERDELSEIICKGSHRSQKVLNALILLNCDVGPYQDDRTKNEDIARILRVSMRKIDRLKKRLVENGLEIALDTSKGQREYKRKIDGDFEAHLIAVSCNSPPEGHAKWTLRLLAEKMVELEYVDQVSHETIRQVLKKTN